MIARCFEKYFCDLMTYKIASLRTIFLVNKVAKLNDNISVITILKVKSTYLHR